MERRQSRGVSELRTGRRHVSASHLFQVFPRLSLLEPVPAFRLSGARDSAERSGPFRCVFTALPSTFSASGSTSEASPGLDRAQDGFPATALRPLRTGRRPGRCYKELSDPASAVFDRSGGFFATRSWEPFRTVGSGPPPPQGADHVKAG